jgi:hypothetical protein
MAESVHFTAIAHSARQVYFAVVDESLVPSLSQSNHLDPSPSTYADVPAKLSAATFDAQYEAYRSGVQRPDMGLGAAPDVIVQSINSAIAAYAPAGQLLPGWPKLASSFFGLPVRQFMVDPRLVYDAWDRRFWAAYLSDSMYLLAVSQTSNPGGKWNVYGFDVSDGTDIVPDFTQMAIDRHTVSISSHLFNTQHLNDFHAGIYTLRKSALENGVPHVTPRGFTKIAVNGTALDTIEPVMVPDSAGGSPAGEYFFSTAGFNFLCYNGFGTCKSLYVFMVTTNGNVRSLDGISIKMPPYVPAPEADTPTCLQCLEAVGPMMTSPAVYRSGLISFAYGTGAGRGVNSVAAIQWGQLAPVVVGGHLKSASLTQTGLFRFPGDQSAMFPAVMTDSAGNFYMLLDSSSSTLNPSVYIAARKKDDPPNELTATLLLKGGLSPPTVSAWGDFTAASFNGTSGVWFASQYAGRGLGLAQYGTVISNVHF